MDPAATDEPAPNRGNGLHLPAAARPAAAAEPPRRASAPAAARHLADEDDDDEDLVVEQDPEGRFSRYGQVVGSGRFKTVYKAFDERRGVDVAWSKVVADEHRLSPAQLARAVEEMSAGLSLDHPAVIRSYQCWEDPAAGCVNLVTEFFTSGNLRDYRRRHAALENKAVKKWARQVLGGLAYLHGRDPPVVHGDLRADKVYINGHTGEIKIGDLGLEALVPRRFAPGVVPDDPADQYTRAVDVFAFGLMILELVTARPMDRGHSREWAAALAGVTDAGARAFIGKCLSPEPERPAAAELLRDAFLAPPAKVSPPADGSAHGGSMLGGGGGSLGAPGGSADADAGGGSGGGGAAGAGPPGVSGRSYAAAAASAGPDAPAAARRAAERAAEERERAARAECEAGSVRGEDYLFQFSGRVRDGKLHFRLHMAYEGDEDGAGGGGPGGGSGGADDARSSKTIDFVYDPDTDTADEIAAEISSEFDLSPTDRDICAAALKEWLADRGPDAGGSGGRD